MQSTLQISSNLRSDQKGIFWGPYIDSPDLDMETHSNLKFLVTIRRWLN